MTKLAPTLFMAAHTTQSEINLAPVVFPTVNWRCAAKPHVVIAAVAEGAAPAGLSSTEHICSLCFCQECATDLSLSLFSLSLVAHIHLRR